VVGTVSITDVWTRMPDVQKPTGIRIRFTHDKVTRAHLVNGVVLDECDVTADYEKQEGHWLLRGHSMSVQGACD